MPIEFHNSNILTLEQERRMLVDMRNHYQDDNPNASKLLVKMKIEEMDKSIRSIDEAIEANRNKVQDILNRVANP